jgi:ubiquinone/menaquinone biosynthesis C-methylase UbiE
MTNNNVFSNPEIASDYETWYQTVGSQADKQEKVLLKRLLRAFSTANSILEIGCGTGHFTRWFSQQGMQVIGLDLSRAMLEEANRFRSSLLLQGDALKLPFGSNSFDLIALITTLEFLPDPIAVLNEVHRVARKGLVLGVLNTQSCLGRKYKRSKSPIWKSAQLFTLGELKQLIQQAVGEEAEIIWRTTLWPVWPASLPLPWGGFIGMAVNWK